MVLCYPTNTAPAGLVLAHSNPTGIQRWMVAGGIDLQHLRRHDEFALGCHQRGHCTALCLQLLIECEVVFAHFHSFLETTMICAFVKAVAQGTGYRYYISLNFAMIHLNPASDLVLVLRCTRMLGSDLVLILGSQDLCLGPSTCPRSWGRIFNLGNQPTKFSDFWILKNPSGGIFKPCPRERRL